MENKINIKDINEKIEKESAFIDLLIFELNKVIVGQKSMIERLLIGLLGQGHILLEGVPGLAKTLVINSLSKAIKGSLLKCPYGPSYSYSYSRHLSVTSYNSEFREKIK